jgi:hypothetical protein
MCERLTSYAVCIDDEVYIKCQCCGKYQHNQHMDFFGSEMRFMCSFCWKEADE